MTSFPDHEPLTRADLAGLTQAVLQVTTAQWDDYQSTLAQARSEIRTEAGHLGEILRTEVSQVRHDILVRLEVAARRLETIVDGRDHRIIAVLLASQLAVVATLSAVIRLAAP